VVIHRYNFPTKICYGVGALSVVSEALLAEGLSRPLLVTDRDLAQLPPTASVVSELKQARLDLQVFSGVYGNPTASQVLAGVEAFKAHSADSIVALGGGAAIDVAKAIALMAHHPGELHEYEDEKPGARPIDQAIPYWVSIPTTAGTGSEVGRSTVISDDISKVKKIYFSPRLLAKLAVLDPTLSVALPAKVTAATGLDAFTHLVEAFLAKGVQPLCDGIALQGLKLVARFLPSAVEFAKRVAAGEHALLNDAAHLEARGEMLNAAMMGGVAFQKGLGVTHSMAHALGTVKDLHHGLANGILVPYTMRFNRGGSEAKFAELAWNLGLPTGNGTDFVSWLFEFCAALGIPRTLREVGVKEEELPSLVALALRDGCHLSNPRAVSEADMTQLFQAAWSGT
jgi:alcohol dehydrogenase class IV